MANRFWVGGGSSTSWAATANTNWATTSGGANNASVPGSSDFCIFDGNSGSGTSAIASNAAITVQGVDFTGFTGTLTHSFNATITINTAATNALKFSSGMTYNYSAANTSSGWTFTNTSGTAVLTSAGKSLIAITVSGAGGTVQQADDLTIGLTSGALTLTNGTFDGNGQALTIPVLNASTGSTRALILGSSVTLGGNLTSGATAWNFSSVAGLTFTKNSANITLLAPIFDGGNATFNPGGQTFNGLTINPTTGGGTLFLSGNGGTFSSLSVGAGNFISMPANQTTTVTNAFTLAGTAAAPIILFSNSTTAAATISCPSGICSINWGLLVNMVATGGATFTATNSFLFGLTSGWSVTGPADGTTAAIVTAIWTDLLAGSDFSTGSSAGALIKSLSNLQYTVPAIGRGTVTTGSQATSIKTSAYAPTPSASVANQLVGHVALFDANTTTTALRGQVALISASTASATPTLSVSALTATPASGDTFSVI